MLFNSNFIIFSFFFYKFYPRFWKLDRRPDRPGQKFQKKSPKIYNDVLELFNFFINFMKIFRFFFEFFLFFSNRKIITKPDRTRRRFAVGPIRPADLVRFSKHWFYLIKFLKKLNENIKNNFHSIINYITY